MTTPTEHVDENRVYDLKAKTWIPYNSRSDALLANLVLQRNFTLDQLNSVLEVLQDPGFDKSQTTINMPTDVLRAVSLDEGGWRTRDRGRSRFGRCKSLASLASYWNSSSTL